MIVFGIILYVLAGLFLATCAARCWPEVVDEGPAMAIIFFWPAALGVAALWFLGWLAVKIADYGRR